MNPKTYIDSFSVADFKFKIGDYIFYYPHLIGGQNKYIIKILDLKSCTKDLHITSLIALIKLWMFDDNKQIWKYINQKAGTLAAYYINMHGKLYQDEAHIILLELMT